MWELWRQDDQGGELLAGITQHYWVREGFAVGQHVELYPTIPSELGGSVAGGTRGIVEAVDGARYLAA